MMRVLCLLFLVVGVCSVDPDPPDNITNPITCESTTTVSMTTTIVIASGSSVTVTEVTPVIDSSIASSSMTAVNPAPGKYNYFAHLNI